MFHVAERTYDPFASFSKRSALRVPPGYLATLRDFIFTSQFNTTSLIEDLPLTLGTFSLRYTTGGMEVELAGRYVHHETYQCLRPAVTTRLLTLHCRDKKSGSTTHQSSLDKWDGTLLDWVIEPLDITHYLYLIKCCLDIYAGNWQALMQD